MAVFSKIGLLLDRLPRFLAKRLFSFPLYEYTLFWKRPNPLGFKPTPVWIGDDLKGKEILNGKLISEFDVTIKCCNPSTITNKFSNLTRSLNSFIWVRDLAAIIDQKEARSLLQSLIRDWITQNNNCSTHTWSPGVTGQRISIWLEYYDQLLSDSSISFRRLFTKSISRQFTHLKRSWRFETRDIERILGIKGLIYFAICFPKQERFLIKYLNKLEFELKSQVLNDGGHIQRSPNIQLKFLRELIEIQHVLQASKNDVPEILDDTIVKMATVLQFYKHPDGRLSHFNGSHGADKQLIQSTLKKVRKSEFLPQRLPATGFERLISGRIFLLADTGLPPPIGHDQVSHAGTLSFEMSVGSERVITNCGAIRSKNKDWQMVQRTTAAHSTVTIEDRNSSEITKRGGIGGRRAITSTVWTEGINHFKITAQHNGYKSIFGITHLREIKLYKMFELIEGVDLIEGRSRCKFYIRFHIHPNVAVSLSQDEKSAIMKLHKGGGWRLTASDWTLKINESVFLERDIARRTSQIVIQGLTQPGETIVGWRIEPA